MTEQFRIVRREIYPGRYEHGIAAFYKESWMGEPRMVIPFRNYGDDEPRGRLRHLVSELQAALFHPVINFKDL